MSRKDARPIFSLDSQRRLPVLRAAGDNVNVGDSTSFFTFADEPGSWPWNFGDGSGDSVGFGPTPRYEYPTVDSFIFTATITPDDSTQCVVRVRDTVWVSEPPLAAAMLDFQGVYTNADAIALSWRSIPEPSQALFQLERSLDGNHFARLADVRVQEAAAGDQRYAFWDETAPWRQVGYRLRPIDVEGHARVAKILTVQPPAHLQLQFGPNPARDALYLDIRAAAESSVRLRLTDIYGKTVRESEVHTQAGLKRVTLDVADLSSGIYLLRAWDPFSGRTIRQGKVLLH